MRFKHPQAYATLVKGLDHAAKRTTNLKLLSKAKLSDQQSWATFGEPPITATAAPHMTQTFVACPKQLCADKRELRHTSC
ncbi:hypothetical protein TBK1r_11020 [Stieleria magnilauensis]|uniref:Uncharacterized protein n=1 Tax=Stieleria magnilauensis TaxID=2527963 RepID=A0ABX5XJL1_9BACT|nr:hypothetical protein TBK1r_11020 [Planctomycetes bacterium TBK1r]